MRNTNAEDAVDEILMSVCSLFRPLIFKSTVAVVVIVGWYQKGSEQRIPAALKTLLCSWGVSITSHTDMHFLGVSWYSLVTRGTRCEQLSMSFTIPATLLGSSVNNQRLARWSRTRSCPSASGKRKPAGRPWMCFKVNGYNYFCVI